jgi:hypothetical protein
VIFAPRVVTDLIIAAGKRITAVIRKGKPIPTLFGAFAGAVVGASSALVMIELTPPLVLLGALAGAMLAAVLFKRSPSMLGARATELEPFRAGAVLQVWTFEADDFKSLVVLLDHALYVVREDSAPWEDVLRRLAQGEDPELQLGELIRLDELTRIEMRRARCHRDPVRSLG